MDAKISIRENPNTVRVELDGQLHEGTWDDEGSVEVSQGDQNVLAAALMAWEGLNDFTLTKEELSELGGGFV